MWQGIIIAIASAITSLVVTLITQRFNDRNKRQEEERQKRDRINLTYLNPLRLYLEENYARLIRINQILSEENNSCSMLTPINSIEEIPKDDSWFINDGYYLISSSYLLACLFFYIKKVKADVPYLELDKSNDTELLTLLHEVSLSFARKGNIYYVVQSSLGEGVYLKEAERIMTYREFCKILQEPEHQTWFAQLVNFFIATGEGKRTEKIHAAIEAVQKLSRFLERHLDGKRSIETRIVRPS